MDAIVEGFYNFFSILIIKIQTFKGVELSAQSSSIAQDPSKDQKITKIQNKKIKSSDIQSPSKSETTKTIKTSKPFTHRSSHDDVMSSSNKTNIKEEKKSKRTQSVERERKKKGWRI